MHKVKSYVKIIVDNLRQKFPREVIMLNLAVRNTGKLIREKSKSENIRLGRLFTKKDTARLLGSMLELDETKAVYTVLDAILLDDIRHTGLG